MQDSMQSPQVVTVTQAQPGFVRSVLQGVGRLIATLAVTFLVLAMIGGIFIFLVEGTPGPRVSVYREGDLRSTVAIINLTEVIDDSAAQFVADCVSHVLDSSTIKAVVLRVDSPGGGVTASDHIWYEINRLKGAGLPVIASYGGIAASGGVYASCHSDFIFAEPTTLTGSIGVIMEALTLGGMLEKIGVTPETLVASESPDKDVANTVFREWTDEDRQEVRKILDSAYAVFFKRVYEGRKHVIPDESRLRAIADGSIYTADEAVANGLVDQIGYLDDAITQAITAAALPADAQVVQLDEWVNPWEMPFGLSLGGSGEITADEIRSLWYDLSQPQAMFLMKW